MKKLLLVMALFPSLAFADSINLGIPAQSPSFQSDRFRAGELDCSNAIGSATTFEMGVMGIVNENDSSTIALNQSSQNGSFSDYGVYGRVVIPIGGPRERISCNTLYEIELRKKRLEVERLELELERLRTNPENLEFE